AATISYSIPVSSGTMNVVLHFAETYFGAPGKVAGGTGKRMFNVDIEGSRKLTNYDIYARAGGAVRPVLESFAVTVTDGILNINLTSGSANMPKISAIEVLPQLNAAPVLAVIGSKTATAGQPLSFTASATDPDQGQSRTFALVNAPSGAAINASTGVFSWTPAAAGTFTLTVKVTDNGSPALSDEETITVTVGNAPVGPAAIRINTGSTAAYTTVDGRQFSADQYYGNVTGGTGTLASTVDILNTTDDVLYRSERSAATISYSIPVTSGTISVVLHFAETYFGAPGKVAGGTGKRMFNVDIEGSRKLTNYDIYARAGGAVRPVLETFAVTVTDGILNINFTSGSANMPKISAIEVLPQTPQANAAPVLAVIGSKTATVGQPLSFTASATDPDQGQSKTFALVNAPSGAAINASTGVFSWTPAAAGTFTLTVKVTDNGSPALSDEETVTVTVGNATTAAAIRINAGATTAFTTADGRQFSADRYFGGTNGTTTLANTVDILNTTNDELYRSERSSAAFNYSIPVTNGTMNVVLHFAETWFGAPGKVAGGTGKRMFNVDIEGSRKLTNYDIYAKAGGAVRPVLETFAVTVRDGVLNINFTSGSANLPKISAIEVVPQTATAGARISQEVEIFNPETKVELKKSTVYPNPVQKSFTVEFSGQHTKDVTLELINQTGRSYKIDAPKQSTAGSKAEIDISNLSLAEGIYMLKIQSAAATEVIKVYVVN
ncbi:T9SS type A sorting domain-containing protein, partial [Dyadobacter flavalbus]